MKKLASNMSDARSGEVGRMYWNRAPTIPTMRH